MFALSFCHPPIPTNQAFARSVHNNQTDNFRPNTQPDIPKNYRKKGIPHTYFLLHLLQNLLSSSTAFSVPL